jgi:hypothetical protein
MPHKHLPKSLVNRLRNASKEREASGRLSDVKRFFSRLKNRDHRFNPGLEKKARFESFLKRHPDIFWSQLKGSEGATHRVREIDVSKNYPKVGKVILKVIDNGSKEVLFFKLDNFKKVKVKGALIRHPKIYLINDEMFVMAKTNFPSVMECFSSYSTGGTKRGSDFIKKELKKSKITREEFEKKASEVCDKLGVGYRNLLFLGIKKEKPAFMPLPDIY